MVAHAFNHSTWEAVAGLWVQGQPTLPSKFQNSQGYAEKALSLKKKKNKKEKKEERKRVEKEKKERKKLQRLNLKIKEFKARCASFTSAAAMKFWQKTI